MDELGHELGKRLGAVLVALRQVLDRALLEVDLELVALADRLRSLGRLKDRVADVDRVAEKDPGEGVGDDAADAGSADGDRGANRFTARVLVQRYEGAQTVYSLGVLGGKLAALELGSSARYAVDSEVEIVLPPSLCWAYPDMEETEVK